MCNVILVELMTEKKYDLNLTRAIHHKVLIYTTVVFGQWNVSAVVKSKCGQIFVNHCVFYFIYRIKMYLMYCCSFKSTSNKPTSISSNCHLLPKDSAFHLILCV